MIHRKHLLIGLAVLIAAGAAVMLGKTFIGTEEQRVVSLDRAPADDMRHVIGTVKDEHRRAAVDRIYVASGYRPLWSGRGASSRMSDLEEALGDIRLQGVEVSTAESARAAVAAAGDIGAQMKADLLLTDQVLHLAEGLRGGFVDLADWEIAAGEFDVVPEVADAVRSGKVRQLVRNLTPPQKEYRGLVAALAQYREIKEKGGWPTVAPGAELKIDSKDPRLTILRERLAAEGYLSSSTGDLTAAVKAFQARNGLEADGRIGAATFDALTTPVEERIGQIIANLERWRHMPRDLGDDRVAVNVADQSLALIRGGNTAWTTRTIVGDRRTPTPVIKADITGVTVNPNWDIPPSIATKELLPKLKQDPRYLVDRNIVVVDENPDASWTVVGWDESMENFPHRLRQLPGSGNSLGVLKFQMDNRLNIYLHDTPNRELFVKEDRYHSHGCVRVENPVELASRVTGRDAQEIDEAILTGETKTLPVKPPLPVYIMYWTAFADDGDAVQFRDDAYGRDQPIAATLGFIAAKKPAQVVSRNEEMSP